MNRGDTSFLMLNYTINGDPLSEGEYQEIELTINAQPSSRCIQKKAFKQRYSMGYAHIHRWRNPKDIYRILYSFGSG